MNPAMPGKCPESQAAKPMTHADMMTLKLITTILSTRYLIRRWHYATPLGLIVNHQRAEHWKASVSWQAEGTQTPKPTPVRSQAHVERGLESVGEG